MDDSQILEIYNERSSASTFPKIVGDQDGARLRGLLLSFDMEMLLPVLNASGVTYRSLKYLTKEDIHECIKEIGLRAEFREKLFAWRKAEFDQDDDTISMESRINSWCEKRMSTNTMSAPEKVKEQSIRVSTACCEKRKQANSLGVLERRKERKDVASLLRATAKGRAVINKYNKHGFLANKQRDDLITILAEDFVGNDINLSTSDYPPLINEIVELFPSEQNAKEYYYIKRDRGKNPGGKLYSKYFNMKVKRKKLTASTNEPSAKEAIPGVTDKLDYSAYDELMEQANKTLLRSNKDSWEELVQKWQESFLLRQKELKTMSHRDFFDSWTKYKDSRAPKLIQMDFNRLYPNKENALFEKWNNFRNDIQKYYAANIRKPICIQLLAEARDCDNEDSSDYILLTLLNAVLRPSARFVGADGMRKLKSSIEDGMECFILRLNTIDDLERAISEVASKYYNSERTNQPYLIVEGAENTCIYGFYIYFDAFLYKFDTFLEAVDTCFKIYQVFQLPYPMACHYPWTFVQHHFYDIHTENDPHSPSLSSLTTFMLPK